MLGLAPLRDKGAGVWGLCVSPAVRQKGTLNLTVVGHPRLLAVVPRLAETFESGTVVVPGRCRFCFTAIWSGLLFCFFLSQEACF